METKDYINQIELWISRGLITSQDLIDLTSKIYSQEQCNDARTDTPELN